MRGHYRDGHWVRPHFRRSPRRKRSIPSQRSQRSNRPNKSTGKWPPVAISQPTTFYRDTHSKRDNGHRSNRREQERREIQEAAEFCMTTIRDGSIEATADKIAGRVSQDAWNILLRKWNRFRCRWLARLAQHILDAKTKIHTTVADVVMRKWHTPLHSPERVFAHELIKSIPLPGDEHFIASAYSLRLAGVCLCAMQGIPLSKCACFRPLALEYTKERIRSILVSASIEWKSPAPKSSYTRGPQHNF